MTYSKITYVALHEERLPLRASILDSEDITHYNLLRLGFLPSTLEQLVYGCDIYQMSYLLNVFCDYQIVFVYPDGIEHFFEHKYEMYGKSPIVFLLCTNNEQIIMNYCVQLSRYHSSNIAYLVDDSQKDKFLLPNTFTETDSIISYLCKQAEKLIVIDASMSPYTVPLFARSLDNGILFKPSRVNTLTAQRVVGNWCFPVKKNTEEDIYKASASAHENPYSTERQDTLVEQIAKINAIERLVWEQIETSETKNLHLYNQLRAPLILCVPFTNADMRKMYEVETQNSSDKQIQEAVAHVLNHEYTLNYVVVPQKEVSSDLIQQIALVSNLLVDRRMEFLDRMAILHGSFRHSPYLRLPLQGVSVNTELSYVRPELSKNLVNSSNKEAVEKVMSKFGEKLAKRTLADSAKIMLKERPSQIVAITDLPIEWLDDDGIPLGFTHGVCRVPEFPHSGIVQQYCFAILSHYVIPKDILNHTLVVYGCRDAGFKFFQDFCDKKRDELGYSTCVCENKKSFIEALKKYKPQFLIVDTHGNVDTGTRTGYLLMGSEKVYPSDIIQTEVHIPLVFLSACNTAPAYESYNTVASAFFNNGALSVTCSYMPVNLYESSVLYIRLLQQLGIAASTKVHANWCEFISHLQRTSYIQSFFMDHTPKKNLKFEELTKEESDAMSLEMTKSMFFQERRAVYERLQSGIVSNNVRTKYNNVVPHYLIYTTLGRADLVRFQSFMDSCLELGKKLMN